MTPPATAMKTRTSTQTTCSAERMSKAWCVTERERKRERENERKREREREKVMQRHPRTKTHLINEVFTLTEA